MLITRFLSGCILISAGVFETTAVVDTGLVEGKDTDGRSTEVGSDMFVTAEIVDVDGSTDTATDTTDLKVATAALQGIESGDIFLELSFAVRPETRSEEHTSELQSQR